MQAFLLGWVNPKMIRMSQTNTPEVSTKDRERLRRLAGRVMELATTPHMDELRRLWNKFNRLEPERPMICLLYTSPSPRD